MVPREIITVATATRAANGRIIARRTEQPPLCLYIAFVVYIWELTVIPKCSKIFYSFLARFSMARRDGYS